MSTRLIQVVAFANVGASATVVAPHNININDVAKKPDFVAADAAGFTVVVTAATVSVTNNNAAPASVNVWLELKHSIPRELGALVNLTPQPFVASPGGTAGGSGQAAGTTGAGTVPSPLQVINGSFLPAESSVYFDDLVTDALITKSKDAGGVTSIQHVDRRHAVGSERMLVQNVDGTWATFVFGQVNGPSVGGGFSLYQFADSPITNGTFEWRVAGEEGAPQALDDWTALIGMTQTDQPTVSNAQVAGFYFHANFARYGNGNWWAVMSDGAGGFVQADTGIALDFSWHRYTINYDATAQQLTFFIDGVQVAQLSTAVVIPTAYSPMLSVGNTGVGVSDQRDYYADYFYGFVNLTRGNTF